MTDNSHAAFEKDHLICRVAFVMLRWRIFRAVMELIRDEVNGEECTEDERIPG